RLENYNSNKETLLGIAFESGFQSKASFNRVFKLKTGLSPSNYIKNF
ncbi:MAG TPA: AraC family transcriptional regulator, partial [Marinilabiliales bacterium]|nr:AraC family transcriptional regulator [Marinilabiliales bacterium]